jgi:methyl-accepting chemotaxis protein
MLNNISLRTRLVLTMAFLGLLILALGLIGMVGMGKADHFIEQIYSDQLATSIATSDSKNFLNRARFTLDRAALHPDAPDVANTIKRGLGFIDDAEKSWKEYMALPHDEEEKALADDLQAKRSAYISGLLALGKAIGEGDTAETDQLVMKKLTPLYGDFNNASIAMDKFQLKQAKDEFDQADAMFRTIRTVAIAAMLVAAVLMVLASVSLMRSIMGPLEQALEHFDAMSKGDLSTRIEITSRNEMSKLLEGLGRMQAQLASTVHSVREGSMSIATATTEIAAGNLNLSGRTEQQAGSLEETASSLEELTSTVRNNADNARQANQLALTASDVAVRGGQLVSQVVQTMGAINDSSKRIVDIISVIDGIAFQTNILALNAAVEAARAGEQGRGFAVVASEVRSLAQRSAAAAKEIKELITTSVTNVDAGAELVDRAGNTMDEIVTSVRHVTDIMGEIMSAGEEQSSGIDQINRAIGQMDEMTQQNAALVEQAAAAADSLQEQAAALEQLVSVFRIERGSGQPRVGSAQVQALALRG